MLDHSLLLTDLYQLSMMEVYRRHDMSERAVFELFVRKLPAGRGFLMMAGLEQLVHFLEQMRYSPEELAWLRSTGLFSSGFIDSLVDMRFTGDLDSMAEGTVFFADEPVVRITAPLPQAQLVESRLINLVHYQTIVASKAARMVLSAPGRALVDFGFRRAHGAEAGLLAARAAYLAGFAGTATLAANRTFGVPMFGTMAHSFIQAHDDEATALERFALARPGSLTLLIDTYDTEAGARLVVRLAPRLAASGIAVAAVRLDSGDLAMHARNVRAILDAADLRQVRIMASGGLDEHSLQALVRQGAPIDSFGIGTSLTTSSDAPALDCAYKLQEYAGRPRRKLSEGKATWPGRKQVWRQFHADGTIARDTVTLAEEVASGEPLLLPVLRAGRRVKDLPVLAQTRAHAATSLESLPEPLRRLEEAGVPVQISPALRGLATQMDEARRP
ncbi:MAG: nicotinate phosphoribosyltransferase [Reyranella sp.]|uniref:nicotinate phosphoribosyltransferase n=1 Tax=Reyranella sp. TaxID=1929291 RepID=UPI003D149CB3